MIAPASEPAIVSPVAANVAASRPRTANLPVLLRLVLITPLALLTHCAGKGYKAASYSAEKLATPAHNMSQRDYPFDADGNYRKDWVKSGSTRPGSANVGSRTSRSSSSTAPASTTIAANTRSTPAPTRSSASSAPRTISPPRTTVPAARTAAASTTTYRPAPAPAPKPKPKPTPPPARYHKVEAKQTLWAISQKYGVTVEALQRANGLSGTLIRPGQSLRIP